MKNNNTVEIPVINLVTGKKPRAILKQCGHVRRKWATKNVYTKASFSKMFYTKGPNIYKKLSTWFMVDPL